MKKIFTFLFFLVCLSELLAGDVLVRVGKNFLTEQNLQEYMLENSLSDRVKGLEGLIRQQLILDYANQQGVQVANQEIAQYYQDEMGQSVDMAALRELEMGNSQELKMIRRELVMMKARELIKSNLEIDMKSLLQDFLLESAQIDISYFIADWSLFDLPESFTYSDLEDFADDYYSMFDRIKKIKFEYTIVLKDEDKSADDLSFLFEDWQIGLQTYLKNVARQLAEDLTSAWEDGIQPDRQIFSTDFIDAQQKIADFEQIDLQPIFQSKKSCFMYEIPAGFLLIKKARKKSVAYFSQDGDYQKVIRDYIAWVANLDQSKSDPYRKYFEENLYSLTDKKVGVRVEYLKFDNLNYLQRLDLEAKVLTPELKQNVIKDTTIFFFTDKFALDKSSLVEQIRQKVISNNLFGSIKDGDNIVHYNTIVYNSAYLPSFEQAKNYLYDKVKLDKQKQKKYNLEKYYEKHFNKFQRPTQLGMSGLLVKYEDFDTLEVQAVEIENYYLEYKADFATAGKRRYDCIYLEDVVKNNQDFVGYLYKTINDDNFPYIKKCFGDEFASLTGNFLDYPDLDNELKKRIDDLGVGKISEPFYYKSGWIILKKGEDYQDNYLSLEDAKPFIREKLIAQKQEECALQKIKELDQKVKWYGDLKSYKESEFYFQTKYHSITEPFDYLGNLMPYEGDFVKMYSHKKYDKIFKLPDGYAVFFLDKIYKSSVLPFEEVKPQIVEQIESEKKEENARKFLSVFTENLNSEDFASSVLLSYLGKQRQLKSFSLDNKLPWTTQEENRQVFKLAMKGSLGVFRPAIYLSCGKYLVYRVDSRSVLSKDEFNQKKNAYLADELDRLSELWLDEYRKKVMIKYYR